MASVNAARQRQIVFVAALMVFAVWLIASGWTDSDWQLVSYRYSEWHRTVEYWEYNPYLKVNWWLAWQINIFKFALGSGIIGFLISEYRWRLKNG